ncbi:MAG: hypothetical protein MK081_07315 [Flavobacteriales bacterium]|nr:hypothetical protein [Flavobacteriales bacterium]
MSEIQFPIFCQLKGGNSFYRVDSHTHMTEYQRIGSRYTVYTLEAKILPERNMIMDLIEDVERYERMSEEEFEGLVKELKSRI